MCVSVLWATLSFMGRDSDPVFGPALLPDSICSVHLPCPEALIPSDQGASSNTRPTNGLRTWLSGLPPTSQRPSISPQSFYRAFCTQAVDQACLGQPCRERHKQVGHFTLVMLVSSGGQMGKRKEKSPMLTGDIR